MLEIGSRFTIVQLGLAIRWLRNSWPCDEAGGWNGIEHLRKRLSNGEQRFHFGRIIISIVRWRTYFILDSLQGRSIKLWPLCLNVIFTANWRLLCYLKLGYNLNAISRSVRKTLMEPPHTLLLQRIRIGPVRFIFNILHQCCDHLLLRFLCTNELRYELESLTVCPYFWITDWASLKFYVQNPSNLAPTHARICQLQKLSC